MTPQEKAKELIENYRYRLLPFITFQTQLTEADLFNKCKQCALIAVDEIIEALDLINEKYNKFSLEFYIKVKQEIEKL